ncbi:1-deoxy-D-xylulose 5-phosphate reductoisomerase [hydrothermal vent metagenome]|uniref:1-deoxy-D-xylulose-5-phosphate reductoisomerase n=1 Tax=hydrothermal vent metagenome TaxID=652676 RepID=A0A3B1CMB9_9ZZZZ
MKNIAILGSTGSIGVSALKVIESQPDHFRVIALSARSNLQKLASQIEKFRPSIVSVADKEKAETLKSMIQADVKITFGLEGAMECAASEEADMVISAMVGATGLAPTMAAIKAGKDIALANKESMVTAGQMVMREAEANHVKIVPIDSEHSAIFQALRGEKISSARRLILTASGGPFLRKPYEELDNVTVEEALNHPNWSMGRKIAIDSATMMNKGLEVIEARWLFNFSADDIDTLVHPQSIIHSMVEFSDSSVIAQLGLPDMRTPIAFALSFPERLETELASLNLAQIKTLTFEAVDTKKFPLLAAAYEALRMGGSAPAVLNSANETAVEAFLKGEIKFTGIAGVVEKVLFSHRPCEIKTMEEAIDQDRWGRTRAREIIARL